MKAACDHPVPFPDLVDYWLEELPPAREAPFEEHVFACAHCSERLEELAALGNGVRAAFRSGTVRAILSRDLLESMRKEGLRLREYRVAPGGAVQCTISTADDFVVGRLQAPLAGVKRVDVVSIAGDGKQARFEDVPFDPDSGEVLVCPAPTPLRKMPVHTERVQLVAVDAGGERTLGEYTFNHTPS